MTTLNQLIRSKTENSRTHITSLQRVVSGLLVTGALILGEKAQAETRILYDHKTGQTSYVEVPQSRPQEDITNEILLFIANQRTASGTVGLKKAFELMTHMGPEFDVYFKQFQKEHPEFSNIRMEKR